MTKKIILLLSIAGPFITYYIYASLVKINKKKYPIKTLSLVTISLIIASLGYLRFSENYSPNLAEPNAALKPFDVLVIQLNSLKRNNIPYNDAGIEQVWKFAHPDKKKITGPLEKFKEMIYSKNYRMLISHENSEITILSENANTSVYKVFILSNDKKRYSYIWHVKKVEREGELMGCWMTTIVSTPEYLGEVI